MCWEYAYPTWYFSPLFRTNTILAKKRISGFCYANPYPTRHWQKQYPNQPETRRYVELFRSSSTRILGLSSGSGSRLHTSTAACISVEIYGWTSHRESFLGLFLLVARVYLCTTPYVCTGSGLKEWKRERTLRRTIRVAPGAEGPYIQHCWQIYVFVCLSVLAATQLRSR